MNSGDSPNQRASPGQRRSFDDVDPSNVPPGSSSQVLRKFFVANKKSRRSTSASGRNKSGTGGAGVIRRASTMFRPPSAAEKRATKANSFEAMEVTDTSHKNFPTIVNANPVLSWMQQDAPPDVLPKILSFCGSRQVNAISRVNKTWNSLITKNELVWRTLCEDTHKVRHYLSTFDRSSIAPITTSSANILFYVSSSTPFAEIVERRRRNSQLVARAL